MEVAGFTLGVVGAVGILGQIFDGCVKAYAYFTTAHNLGRDSERLLCKIRIEEMRLMVWGREWGVAEGKLEAHLAASSGDNDALKKLAETILKQLLDTIGNTKKLKERYGVKESTKESIANGDDKPSPKGADTGNTPNWNEIRLKARWVIGDRDKFEVLLRDLKDFNDGLERLFPPARIATLQRTWQNELLQTAKRDVGQLNLLESASSGVYPRLNTSANLKQLRINLDAEDSAKFKPTSHLKIPSHALTLSSDEGKRVQGQHRRDASSPPEEVIVEWIPYDSDADMETRLVMYQRVDNLARMVHSASNRHPDLHTLDCIGYLDDTKSTRYGLTYRVPQSCAGPAPRTLAAMIDDPQLRTPDLDDRFRLAHTLAVALWSFHSLDWLHKTFCGANILFFDSDPERLARPYVTGFDSSRPDHIDEMTVASRNDLGTDLYRHPDSLGVWRQPYCKAFDVYSLGLALLEIGLWKGLRDFHKQKYSPAVFRDKVVLPALVPRLGSKTGTAYRRVVERCLAWNEKADAQEGGVGRLMEWVVLTLENLRV
ncbi:MAG: hypothetical protein M1832_004833 [Thelocarpon impressellum]|nr:MAG: hypothetical protein M1832_004833 [Thelocarpon impressellum]